MHAPEGLKNNARNHNFINQTDLHYRQPNLHTRCACMQWRRANLIESRDNKINQNVDRNLRPTGVFSELLLHRLVCARGVVVSYYAMHAVKTE